MVLLLFFHKSNSQQNSPPVEFLWEKIEENIKRANTKPSMHFRRNNTEPSMHFKKANTEPSMHFRRANMETFKKYNIHLSEIIRKYGVFHGLTRLLLTISRFPPSGNPSEQPCQHLKNAVLLSSFNYINSLHY